MILLFFRDELLVKNNYAGYYRSKHFFIYFYLFYFICQTIITKNKGKERKKKWRGDLTETIGAYMRGLASSNYGLELFNSN